jgi:hypothetical protein
MKNEPHFWIGHGYGDVKMPGFLSGLWWVYAEIQSVSQHDCSQKVSINVLENIAGRVNVLTG